MEILQYISSLPDKILLISGYRIFIPINFQFINSQIPIYIFYRHLFV